MASPACAPGWQDCDVLSLTTEVAEAVRRDGAVVSFVLKMAVWRETVRVSSRRAPMADGEESA